MNKKENISIKGMIALCLITIGYMADMAIIPAGDAIYTQFADSSQSVLNFIISGPQILAVLAMICSTFLMRKFNKRTLILVSFTIFTICGCAGAVNLNIYYIAIMRALVGFFGGLGYPVALSMINETYYDDEEKGSTMVGLLSGASALIGLIMTISAGFLCVSNWTNVYHVYLAAIPSLIFMFFALPKISVNAPSQKAAEKETSKDVIPWGKVAITLLVVLIASIVANIPSYLGSVYAAEQGIGDSSFAGFFAAVLTLMTTLVCAFFGPIYIKLKRYTSVIMFILFALGYLLLYVAKGQVLALIGSGIDGVAYGLLVSYYAFDVTTYVPISRIAVVTPFITAAVSIGAALSTYAAYGLMGVVGADTIALSFPYFIAIACIGAVLALVKNVIRK